MCAPSVIFLKSAVSAGMGIQMFFNGKSRNTTFTFILQQKCQQEIKKKRAYIKIYLTVNLKWPLPSGHTELYLLFHFIKHFTV